MQILRIVFSSGIWRLRLCYYNNIIQNMTTLTICCFQMVVVHGWDGEHLFLLAQNYNFGFNIYPPETKSILLDLWNFKRTTIFENVKKYCWCSQKIQYTCCIVSPSHSFIAPVWYLIRRCFWGCDKYISNFLSNIVEKRVIYIKLYHN